MTFGCPVLSSNAGSLKEVGGEGLEYFNPKDVDDISYKMEKVLFSEEILKNQIEYGFIRSKKFSWENVLKRHSKYIINNNYEIQKKR